MSTLIYELNQNNNIDPQENVFTSIWNEYEKVIVHSMITSFGLDFLVHDQEGGNVDTILNVRKENIGYKNEQNKVDNETKEEYDTRLYHQNEQYKEINKEVSESKKAGTLIDSYTGKKVARNADIDLDHVISAKEIHDDPGRVLAGLSGVELANCEDNLKPTDRSINRSMKADDIEDYLQKWEENKEQRSLRIKELNAKKSLTDKEKGELEKLSKLDQIDPEKTRTENANARKAYEAKLASAYYKSSGFMKDTAVAAGKRGVEMGIREAFGFVFVEIWFSCKEELQKLPAGVELENIFEAVENGVKAGVDKSKAKHKELFAKLGEGFVSGTLASLTTTICNIFFTTAKNLVKCIRQIYASVVQAGKVLLFNPDDLMLGDRIKTTTVILATGASVLVGSAVGDLMMKTPIASVPGVGKIAVTFCSSLVSGLASCSLLIFLDRSKQMNMLINALNSIPSEVNNYKEIADVFEQLAAKLENIDIALFHEETEKYTSVVNQIITSDNENEVEELLLSAYKQFNIKLPWEGDFDSFMEDESNFMVFE